MTKLRVLFVDDEPHVLDGLRDVLRKQRHVWDMSFASSGEAALETLSRTTTDVVVSDIRMPGMNGAALFELVRARHPGVARIVLTGHAEQDTVVRALAVAHQSLSKPCESGQLVNAVERVATLQGLLRNERVRRIVLSIDRLPATPQTYLDITRAAENPDVALDDIVAIVERDPALVAKTLQVANSAAFGLRQQLTSCWSAVRFLGIDLIRGLALGGHVFRLGPTVPYKGPSLTGLQAHSIATARVATRLLQGRAAADVFTAAMVHDVGHLVLGLVFGERCAEARARAEADAVPYHVVETEMFGADHAEVGAFLLGLWGLPFSIVEATAHHHCPLRVPAREGRQLLAAVYLAEALVESAMMPPGVVEPIDIAFVQDSGIPGGPDEWRRISQLVCEV